MKWTDSLVLKFCVITGMFALVYGINNALTPWLLMVPGAHLVHIPSGIKLVLVLIFEMTGAISVATVSLLAGLLFFFPDQPWVSVELALVNALAPFLMVAWLTSEDGIDRWLETLRPKKIMLMGVVYSALNSSLNQLVIYWNHLTDDIVAGLEVMFIGDLTGVFLTMLILKLIGRSIKARRNGADG